VARVGDYQENSRETGKMYTVLFVWHGGARLPTVSDVALRLVIRVQLHSLIARNRFFDLPLGIAALIPEMRRRG
jgi:hypothetical protein